MIPRDELWLSTVCSEKASLIYYSQIPFPIAVTFGGLCGDYIQLYIQIDRSYQ